MNTRDWGWLVVLGFCAFALLPLFQANGVTIGHDTLLHAHRMAEIQRLWSQGVWLPQWADTFYYGYGSPVFVFYAPLAHWFGAFVLLCGGTVTLAIQCLIITGVFGSGLGMYGFMRQHVSPHNAILSAVCYVYSPFLFFTEAHTRGNYPEYLAFALFPLLLWQLEALMRDLRPLSVACLSLATCGLLLAHNLMGIVLLSLAVLWFGVTFLANPARPLKNSGLVVGALCAGVFMAAFLWVPVYAERDLVRIADVEAFTRTRLYDFFGMFIQLPRLLSFPPRLDWGAENGLGIRFELGVAQWILALMGVAVALITRKNRVSALFWGTLSVLCIALTLPLAYPVWERVSSLSFLTFPWRLIGVASFGISVLAGFAVNATTSLRGWGLAMVGVITLSIPLLSIPPQYTHTIQTSVSDYLEGELSGEIAHGTTSYNEFLPKTAPSVPSPNMDLIADYADGRPIDRLNRKTLSSDTTATLIDQQPQSNTWDINAPQEVTLQFNTLFFSGWQAEIDGQIAPINPTPDGFIAVPMPSGTHQVRVFFGASAERQFGQGLSVLGMAGWLLLIGVARRWQSHAPIPPSAIFTGFRPVGILWVALCGFILLTRQEGIAWVHSNPNEAVVAQQQVAYTLREGDTDIRLIGYDISSRTLTSGAQLQVTLYWYAPQPLAYRYSAFVHISKPETPPIAQYDAPRVGERNSDAWHGTGYVIDTYTITLPTTVENGDYHVTVGVYTCDTMPVNACGNGDRLTVYQDGKAIGDVVPLDKISIK